MTTLIIVIAILIAVFAYAIIRGGADSPDFDPVEMDMDWNKEDRE